MNETSEEKTPQSSQLPKPSYRTDAFDVVIRPNIKDPLNLEGTYGDTNRVVEANRKPRKHRRSISKMENDSDNNLEVDILNENENGNTNKRPIKEIRKRKRTQSLSINGTNYEKTNKITCTISEEKLDNLKIIAEFSFCLVL